MSRYYQGDYLEEARLLLPWYITGRLTEPEKKLVESMLEKHPVLKREYEHEMTMVGLIRENAGLLQLTAMDTTQQRLNKLMKHIERDQQQMDASVGKAMPADIGVATATTKPSPTPPRLLSYLKGWLPKPSWFTPANAVFASLLVIQIGVMAWYMQVSGTSKAAPDNNIYVSASVEDHKMTVPVVTGMVLMVDFNEDAQVKQMRKFLNQWNARILDGPDANNLFKIEVKGVPETDKRSEAILQQMQQDQKVVAFVGRDFKFQAN